MPTTAERLDPKSPHYDAAFAAMRAKAFGAWDAHKADMRTKPEYRAEVVRKYGADRADDGKR